MEAKNEYTRIYVIAVFLALLWTATALADGSVSYLDKFAWSETAGWINFSSSAGGVTVYDDHLEGYIWAKNIGWIKLGSHTGGGAFTYENGADASNWGVNRNGTALSGYAWSETSGWINFSPSASGAGVTLDPATYFMDGWAWGEAVGWIHIRNESPAYGARFLPTYKASIIVGNGGNLYGAQDGAGIWITTDRGATWTAASTQPDERIRGLVIHPTTSTTLYAASYGAGMIQSLDSGETWTSCANTGLGNLVAVSLAVDPTGNLYAGTKGGVFASGDGCATWVQKNTGLPADTAAKPANVLLATASAIHAGVDGAGIYTSLDGGATWTPAATQPSNLKIKALAVKDAANLYAGTTGSGVFKSSNGGKVWSACTQTGLTNLNVLSLQTDTSGRLYAGTEAGVYVSMDNCASWTAINTGGFGKCQNGGSCAPGVSPCVCRCPPGFGGEACETKLKIVQESTYYTTCLHNPAMNMYYYEGDCMRVEPVDAVSYRSKTATCYQENGDWKVHVTKFYDNDCRDKKSEYNAAANRSCYVDREEGIGSMYGCLDTLPQRCNPSSCQNGGVCVEGMPIEYCEQCPAGTFDFRCISRAPTQWILIKQYSSSDKTCSGAFSQTIGVQGSCIGTPDGGYAKYYFLDATIPPQIQVQPYLDSVCSLPTSYRYFTQNGACYPVKGSYWEFYDADSPCMTWECYNGGECRLTPAGRAECKCQDGYTGEHCETGRSGS